MAVPPAGSPQSMQPSPLTTIRGAPLTIADLRRKAHARLAERIDPARVKHKPLSLIRQDAKRILEQFFDTEPTSIPRLEREKLIEEIIGDSVGFGPLEELFRDETVLEILLLAPTQVIVRKGDSWLPTSVRFRDNDHVRSSLVRVLETGESFVSSVPTTVAFDVRSPNGFRVIGILPPGIMDQCPSAMFVRIGASSGAAPSPSVLTGRGASASLSESAGFSSAGTKPELQRGASGIGTKTELLPRGGFGGQGPSSELMPRGGFASQGPPSELLRPRPGSGSLGTGASARPVDKPAGPTFPGTRISGPISMPGARPTPASPAPLTAPPGSSPNNEGDDPFARDRHRITQRIISKFASAGMFDLNAIPLQELRRIVLAHVVDYCAAEKLQVDDGGMEKLASEILSGMNR